MQRSRIVRKRIYSFKMPGNGSFKIHRPLYFRNPSVKNAIFLTPKDGRYTRTGVPLMHERPSGDRKAPKECLLKRNRAHMFSRCAVAARVVSLPVLRMVDVGV